MSGTDGRGAPDQRAPDWHGNPEGPTIMYEWIASRTVSTCGTCWDLDGTRRTYVRLPPHPHCHCRQEIVGSPAWVREKARARSQDAHMAQTRRDVQTLRRKLGGAR